MPVVKGRFDSSVYDGPREDWQPGIALGEFHCMPSKLYNPPKSDRTPNRMHEAQELPRMKSRFHRRQFLKTSVSAVGLLAAKPYLKQAWSDEVNPKFSISLAEWSLHRMLQAGKLDNLDFPKFTKEEFGIDAVEYVNQFFKDKARDTAYLDDLKQRCTDHGVKSLLIMVDGEGQLGDADEKKRTTAVENHYRWLDAAQQLGCHSIRVNAGSSGTYDEQLERAANGLRRLSEKGSEYGLNVIVENHGGLSSNGAWLSSVMKRVDLPNCGTLPDFGNFRIQDDEWYDRYQGVRELMPFAKAVSAKSHDFDAEGNETHTDYDRMMKIVLAAGYDGYVGIEYEGGELDEVAGIKATKKLLQRILDT
jgi:sugar phosphate isomerase/epimerase